MAGYIDWYYAELERRQTTETEKSSAKGDGLGGTEVIGGTEFYQSEECQQFYCELLKIKQAHDAG